MGSRERSKANSPAACALPALMISVASPCGSGKPYGATTKRRPVTPRVNARSYALEVGDAPKLIHRSGRKRSCRRSERSSHSKLSMRTFGMSTVTVSSSSRRSSTVKRLDFDWLTNTATTTSS